jgi:hypothetical protein
MKMPKPNKGAKMTMNKGKGGGSEMLPSRHALASLTKGDPMQRTMSNYAKDTPGVGSESPDIFSMGPMQK